MNITEQPDPRSHCVNADNPEETSERPWIDLRSTDDVEAWIDRHNRDLQQWIQKKNATGYGVCFSLGHGGQIFMHTTEDAILLDVMPEAEWVAPVITASTGIKAPQSRIWVLPDDKLTQLILGLSGLITSTRMIVDHAFKAKKSTGRSLPP